MYAIVEIAGQQFKVEEGRKIYVNQLEAGKDEIIEFDKVLLVEENEKILVGEPTVENYIVEGKVIDQVKGDKVIVFKKKRKKGYRVKKGHRQNYSRVEIIGIGEKGTILRKVAPKKEKAVKQAESEAVEVTPEKKKKTAAKTAEKKPAATKKPVKAEKETEKASAKVEKTPAKKTAEKKSAPKKPAAKKVTKKKE